ncbi:MAG: BMP family ABC transporter substrate-binding protein [Firmicutes bacterium]|nr:BMP family ABC transporter substrate-binding protein [Bacillota bacterium]
MRKVLAILLAAAMVLGLAACGGSKTETPAPSSTPAPASTGSTPAPAATTPAPAAETYKVGMVCIGDDNAAYDRNFYMAADAAKEQLAAEGINVEWVYTYNHPEGDPVAVDCEELADEGCVAVFLNSYGQEPAMLTVAADYPDVVFAGLTNEGSYKDDLPNTINAFPSIYEGRYLAGVAAGCKLNEMIEDGTITADQAVLGYVGAYTFAEVVSGYTAFFLGARSVCPSATMKVKFIGSWGDPTMEAATAQDLIDNGCVLISQHSDSTTPATTAQSNGVYHVGYNISMSDVAPDASIISSRIDWTNFFVKVIKTAVNGEPQDQDYIGHGLKDGDVKLTDLNTKVAADGTADAIAAAQAKIESGELQVFDTSTFTVSGEELKNAFAIDTDGDFAPDAEEAVFDGAFHESYFQSAPYFAIQIDDIELLNVAF